MSEVTCEPSEQCNDYELLFKGLFAQELAFIAQVAPYTESDILPLLQGSAVAAAKSCTGGKDDDLCGSTWSSSKYDGKLGIENQISATAVLIANLITFDQMTLATQSTAKSNASSTTSGSPSSTSDGTIVITKTASASGKSEGNGAGMLASGPVVLISAMVMGVLSIL